MRIAVWHNLPSGGAKRALYDQVRELLALGHEVEVWCPPYANRSFMPLDGLVREHVVPLAWRSYMVRSPLLKLAPQHWNIVSRIHLMDRHVRQCAAEINRGGFDVLLAHLSQHLGPTSIARFSRIPTVLYLQEPHRLLYEALPRLVWAAPPPAGPRGWMPQRLASRLKDAIQTRTRRVQAREEATNAAAFTRLLANSYFSRESMLRAYGVDARVCYLGIDTAKFVDQRLPREHFVLGVGSFTPGKNIELAIDTMTYLPEPRPPLVWIGNSADAVYRASLEQRARASGVRLSLHQEVSEDDLVSAYNTAAVMLYTPRLEPFGYTPLEANACGTAVVTHAEGGCRETVIDGVNGLVAESDPAALAGALATVLQDPTFARRLGEQGRARVLANWTLEAAGQRLEDHLRAATGAPTTPVRTEIGARRRE